MVSGGMACVKYLLFLFNLIFAITGFVFITVGAIILIAYKGYSNFVDIWMFAVPVLMIVVGIVVFITAFFGCCGAVKENDCMMITFSVLLMIIFALELGAGISGYMMRSNVSTMIETCMNDTIREYTKREDYRQSWDIIQHDLQCCGVNGPEDWRMANFPDSEVPLTCCPELPQGKPKCAVNDIKSYSVGCKTQLQKKIEDNGLILGGAGIAVALIQLLGVIFACCLARSIRREYETVETTAH